MTSLIRALALSTSCVFVATAISGCSGGSLGGLTPAPPPTYQEIVQDYTNFNAQWQRVIRESTLSKSTFDDAALAVRYASHGYDLADRACLQFFTKLRELRNKTTFTSNTLSALFAAGGVIAGLSGVASPVLVGLFAAGGLVPTTVQSFNNIYLLAEVADDLHQKTAEAMAKFRVLYPADGTSPDPFSKWNVQERVQQYATLCSLPFMTAAVNQGVNSLTLTTGPEGLVSVSKKK